MAPHVLELSEADVVSRRTAALDEFDSLLASDKWETAKGAHGIEARLLDRGDGQALVCFARSSLPCKPADLFKYLVTDLPTTCAEWNDVMYHASVLKAYERANVGTIISDGKPVYDREDVFLQIFAERGKALYELSRGIGADQVPMNASGAARRSIVRSHMPFASKEFRETADGCVYTTLWQYDVAGWTSALLGRRKMSEIVLQNLVHEHEKLQTIFGGRVDTPEDTTRQAIFRSLAAIVTVVGLVAVGFAAVRYLPS
jgi:hypothetical protein